MAIFYFGGESNFFCVLWREVTSFSSCDGIGRSFLFIRVYLPFFLSPFSQNSFQPSFRLGKSLKAWLAACVQLTLKLEISAHYKLVASYNN
jgi:hypothetical protein